MKGLAIAAGIGLAALSSAMPPAVWADHHRCSNFRSQAEAQAHYRADPVGHEHGPEGHSALDDNGDGVACEALPGPYDHTPVVRVLVGRVAAPRPMPHAGVGTVREADAGRAALAGLGLAGLIVVPALLRWRRAPGYQHRG